MTKVDQLPSELLSLILTYVNNKDLPSCTLINKFFYREAMPLLWRTIDICSEKAYIAFTTCLIQSPNAPGHHVRSLSFANCLELESLGNNNISLHHVPRYCPLLTSLDIWYGRSYGPVAYRNAHATVVSAGHYCKQLTKLDLYQSVYSDYDDLFDALKDAPLTDIQLDLPSQVDKETAKRFVETAPLALHRYQLTRLSIYVYHDTTGFITTINTHGLTWPHLTSFDLKRCESLTDAMALTFVQAHPTLKCLNLDFSNLTNAFLDGLVDYLPNLTTLSVECNPAITALGICRLIKNYDGRLDGVHCEGCGIYPDDVPNDKVYGYQLVMEEEEELDVEWFSGTFYDNSDSEQDNP